jgi:type II secretory pathway pseudopilin PulG
MQSLKRRLSGWSLIELTIILVVLSILCAILARVIGRYVRNAKVIRCREDVQALGSAIWMYIEDTGNSYFIRDGSPDESLGAGRSLGTPTGSAPDQWDGNRVEMLVSDGDIPEIVDGGDASWERPAAPADTAVDFFEYHLVTNNPNNNLGYAYRTPSDLAKGADDYPDDPMFARDESGGFNSEFAWRGPYITAPIDPDPWGNRYASNVIYLDPDNDTTNATPASNGFEEDTVVLSAGPDEEVDTDYDVDGLTPGDDDILYTVSANSRP